MARHRPAPAAPRRAAPAAPARRDSPTGGGTGPGRAGRAAEGAAPGRGARGAGAGTGRVDYERKAAGTPPPVAVAGIRPGQPSGGGGWGRGQPRVQALRRPRGRGGEAHLGPGEGNAAGVACLWSRAPSRGLTGPKAAGFWRPGSPLASNCLARPGDGSCLESPPPLLGSPGLGDHVLVGALLHVLGPVAPSYVTIASHWGLLTVLCLLARVSWGASGTLVACSRGPVYL